MRTFCLVLFSAVGLFAQVPVNSQVPRYQPNYEALKSVVNLTDEQIAQLRKFQQDRMTAAQALYQQIGQKQNVLNQMLEAGSSDATTLGNLMIDISILRKQTSPGNSASIHEQALGVLTDDQKSKLQGLQDSLKLREAGDQALSLNLLEMPPTAIRPTQEKRIMPVRK